MRVSTKYILYFSFIFLCFSSLRVVSQDLNDTIKFDADSNIISSHKKHLISEDYVYVNSSNNRHTLNFYTSQLNTPIYSYDTNLIKKSKIKIDYFTKYFIKPPINLNECIYVNPAKENSFDLYDAILNSQNRKSKPELPYSFLFYSDTLNYFDSTNFASSYLMYLKLNRPLEDFYQPFYFKKTEVTNKEYKEFVGWVRDSIVRQLLSLKENEAILWKDTLVIKKLEPLYVKEEERFYKRKSLDTKNLNYSYFSPNNGKSVINVYPDTLTWVNSFHDSWWLFEEHTNLYFWHPAYDNYPVVGINKKQAEAFLYWKTKRKQAELDRENSNYIIKYELPDEMEWEIVATMNKQSIYNQTYRAFYDNNYFSSLHLEQDTSGTAVITVLNNKIIDSKILNNKTESKILATKCEGCPEKYTLAFPIDIGKKDYHVYLTDAPLSGLCLFNNKLQFGKKSYSSIIMNSSKDENEVLFMGNNVSEWMKDTYQKNWLPVYTYHQNKLKKVNSKYFKHLVDEECFYNEMNDMNGSLVRGGNWYDLSLSNSGGKNFEGLNKKTFVNPNKAFATVGFRYVVKIYRKDELKLIKQ
ncbi:hypothetical protein BH10BAC1_BH10BAC1_13830 [soil metagenome]